MAKAYYFDYVSVPGIFKNSVVEANAVGGAFAYCVYDTLQEYGVQLSSDFRGPQVYADYLMGTDKIKAFIVYYRNGLLAGPSSYRNDGIDISLTADNKLLVDFKFDPLISENSNDEIIADIKAKAVAKALINENAQIHTTNSSYVEKRSGGCYVATAVYGSYDCPEVWTLRRFRDFSLAKSWYGRAFIRLYYAVSPTLVDRFGNAAWFNRFCRAPLDRLVARLRADGYEDSPYND